MFLHASPTERALRYSLLGLALGAFLFSGGTARTHAAIAQYRLETDTLLDSPISSVPVNALFLLKVFVQDLRPPNPPFGNGVFEGTVDVTYNPSRVTANPASVVFGPAYPNVHSWHMFTAGQITQAGAVDGISPLGTGEFLLWEVQVSADQVGTVSFVASPDGTLVYGLNAAVLPSDVNVINATINVVPEPSGFALALTSGVAFALWGLRKRRIGVESGAAKPS